MFTVQGTRAISRAYPHVYPQIDHVLVCVQLIYAHTQTFAPLCHRRSIKVLAHTYVRVAPAFPVHSYIRGHTHTHTYIHMSTEEYVCQGVSAACGGPIRKLAADRATNYSARACFKSRTVTTDLRDRPRRKEDRELRVCGILSRNPGRITAGMAHSSNRLFQHGGHACDFRSARINGAVTPDRSFDECKRAASISRRTLSENVITSGKRFHGVFSNKETFHPRSIARN